MKRTDMMPKDTLSPPKQNTKVTLAERHFGQNKTSSSQPAEGQTATNSANGSSTL